MTTKHTPGPWSVDYRTVKNALGESICSAGNNRKVLGDELDASLRLIAAAPDLLKALQSIMATVAGCQHEPIYEAARAAIAKATGA